MLTNKIILNDEIIQQIIQLYNDGLNRETISKQLNISEWAVRKYLKNKTRTKGESRILYYKNNTVPLSYEQEQTILGSLLGDASLSYRVDRKSYDFQVSHCLEQKELLEYKANILNTNVLSYIKDENSYSAGKIYYKTNFYNKYELEKIYGYCFIDNIKSVNKKWLSKLDEFGIAIWFMDDGTSSFSKKSIVCRFSTLSFPKNQLYLLQQKLLEYNIHTTLQKHSDGEGFIIAVRQKSINDFMSLIEKNILNCMNYKIKRRL